MATSRDMSRSSFGKRVVTGQSGFACIRAILREFRQLMNECPNYLRIDIFFTPRTDATDRLSLRLDGFGHKMGISIYTVAIGLPSWKKYRIELPSLTRSLPVQSLRS